MSDFDTQVDTTIDTAPLPEAGAPGAESTAAEPQLSHDQRLENDIEKAWAAHERARDETSGRFIAKDQAQQTQKPAPQQAAPAAQPAPQAQVETPTPQPGAAAMPAAWSKNDTALWSALPPDAQARIAQREEQIARGFARYEGVAEYADMAERSGTTLRDALTSYRQYEVGMQQNPVATLLNLANLYSVDLNQVFAAAQSGQMPQPVQQPRQVDIGAEIDRRMAARDINSQVATFMADPANKHFDQVEGHVAALLRADRNLSLKDAYDQACWAHPQVRAQLQQDQATKAQAEAAKNARQTTQTAERASKGLVATPGASLKTAPRRMSIDDAIAAAFDQHG